VSFQDSRQRLELLVERVLGELEAVPDALSNQHVASMEKLSKLVTILEEAEARAGKANPNTKASTEDLEDEFE
jgi:hypothetical protein